MKADEFLELTSQRFPSATCHTFPSDTKFKYIASNPVLSLDNKEIELEDFALRQMCSVLGIPHSFASKDLDLMTLLMNWGIEKVAKHHDFMYVIVEPTPSNKTIRALKPRGNPFVSSETLAHRVLQSLGDPVDEVRDVRSDINQYGFSVCGTQKNITPKLGDTVYTGVRFEGSELGLVNPSIASYTYRLACTNGMVHAHRESMYRISSKDETYIIDRVGEFVASARKHLVDDVGSQFKHAIETPVPSAASFLHGVATDYGISGESLSQILAHLPAEEDGTMYGVIQSITRAANFPEFNTNQRLNLQIIAGKILDRVADARCQSCGKLVN